MLVHVLLKEMERDPPASWLAEGSGLEWRLVYRLNLEGRMLDYLQGSPHFRESIASQQTHERLLDLPVAPQFDASNTHVLLRTFDLPCGQGHPWN